MKRVEKICCEGLLKEKHCNKSVKSISNDNGSNYASLAGGTLSVM